MKRFTRHYCAFLLALLSNASAGAPPENISSVIDPATGMRMAAPSGWIEQDPEQFMAAALESNRRLGISTQGLHRTRVMWVRRAPADAAAGALGSIVCSAAPHQWSAESAALDARSLLESKVNAMYRGGSDIAGRISATHTRESGLVELHQIDVLRPDGSGTSFIAGLARGYLVDCTGNYHSANRLKVKSSLDSLEFVTAPGRLQAARLLSGKIYRRIDCQRAMFDALFFADERDKGLTRAHANEGIGVKYSVAGPVTGLAKSSYSEYLLQIIDDVYRSAALGRDELSRYTGMKCLASQARKQIVSVAGFESRFVECAAANAREECHARMAQLISVGED